MITVVSLVNIHYLMEKERKKEKREKKERKRREREKIFCPCDENF